MVQDRQVLVEPVADCSLADDRERRVGVDRAGPGDQEEVRREVLQIVGREGAERLAVDRQFPLRQVARVDVKQPVGLRGRDSMSPRSSQTTNVLPSRIRIIWPAIVNPSAFRWSVPTIEFCVWSVAGRGAGSGPRSLDCPRYRAAPEGGGQRVGSTRGEIVEQASIFARMTQSASASECETATVPRRISTCQCWMPPSRSRSTRSVPLVRSSSGTRPALREVIEELVDDRRRPSVTPWLNRQVPHLGGRPGVVCAAASRSGTATALPGMSRSQFRCRYSLIWLAKAASLTRHCIPESSAASHVRASRATIPVVAVSGEGASTSVAARRPLTRAPRRHGRAVAARARSGSRTSSGTTSR